MGQKSFGDVKTPARAALGNITNRGRPEGGGTQVRREKTGFGPCAEDAPGVARTPAPSAKKAGAETFLESVKAKMSAEQLAEMRQRAERYVDESDDIEYFAGKTREEQLKDLEAKQRADVEARVREVLDGGLGKPAYRSASVGRNRHRLGNEPYETQARIEARTSLMCSMTMII